MNIKSIWNKYKNIVLYIFFGGCTTFVNLLVYWICAHLFNISTEVSTAIAWALAVLFAYFTNRKWVFCSNAKGTSAVIREITLFFVCRLTTGIIDIVGMVILVEVLNLNDVGAKLFLNVAVIVINYVASKMVIFVKGAS